MSLRAAGMAVLLLTGLPSVLFPVVVHGYVHLRTLDGCQEEVSSFAINTVLRSHLACPLGGEPLAIEEADGGCSVAIYHPLPDVWPAHEYPFECLDQAALEAADVEVSTLATTMYQGAASRLSVVWQLRFHRKPQAGSGFRP